MARAWAWLGLRRRLWRGLGVACGFSAWFRLGLALARAGDCGGDLALLADSRLGFGLVWLRFGFGLGLARLRAGSRRIWFSGRFWRFFGEKRRRRRSVAFFGGKRVSTCLSSFWRNWRAVGCCAAARLPLAPGAAISAGGVPPPIGLGCSCFVRIDISVVRWWNFGKYRTLFGLFFSCFQFTTGCTQCAKVDSLAFQRLARRLLHNGHNPWKTKILQLTPSIRSVPLPVISSLAARPARHRTH